MSEPTVLLTGFDPFDDDPVNPSADAVRALDGERIAGHRVVTGCLPVEFGRSIEVLGGLIEATDPSLVLCVGLAGGREAISLERVAINLDDARIPDNAGRQPIDLPVEPGGPPACFARLPLKAMRAALLRAGIHAEVSNTAGTFVCNHVFYGLMRMLETRPATRGGFIHVPPCSAQAGRYPAARCMPTETMAQALRIAVATALTVGEDTRVSAGTEY